MKRIECWLAKIFKKLKNIIIEYPILSTLFSVVLTIVFLLFLVPLISSFLSDKINKIENFGISKLSILNLIVSLIGPILTIILLRNTIEIQKKNDQNYDFNNFNNMYINLLEELDKKKNAIVKAQYKNKNYRAQPDFDRIMETDDYAILKDDLKDLNSDVAIYGDLLRVLNLILERLEVSERNGIIDRDIDVPNFISLLKIRLSELEFNYILLNSFFSEDSLKLSIKLLNKDLFSEKSKENFLNRLRIKDEHVELVEKGMFYFDSNHKLNKISYEEGKTFFDLLVEKR